MLRLLVFPPIILSLFLLLCLQIICPAEVDSEFVPNSQYFRNVDEDIQNYILLAFMLQRQLHKMERMSQASLHQSNYLIYFISIIIINVLNSHINYNK